MAEEVSRPMKYPYTVSAKIAQFPFKFVWNKAWLFKWWVFGSIACAPLFYKIQKLSYSPENVRKWHEIHLKEFYGTGEDHH